MVLSKYDFLTEDEYFDIMDKLPARKSMLDDSDPNKFIAKMGAEALENVSSRIDLDKLSYDLRHIRLLLILLSKEKQKLLKG